MASPNAVSEAATVKIIKTIICPKASSKKTVKETKFKFMDNNNNSRQIKRKNIWWRNKAKPKEPNTKITMEQSKIKDIY